MGRIGKKGFNILAGAHPRKGFNRNIKDLDFGIDLYSNGNASKNIVNAVWEKRLDC
jgi:hypothetical protein